MASDLSWSLQTFYWGRFRWLAFFYRNCEREATRLSKQAPIRVLYIPDRLVQLLEWIFVYTDWLWILITRCTSVHMNALAHFRFIERKNSISPPKFTDPGTRTALSEYTN